MTEQLHLFDGLLVGFCPQCGESYAKQSVRPQADEHKCVPKAPQEDQP